MKTGSLSLKSVTVVANPLTQKIEDLSIVSSVDNKWLFAAAISFLSTNTISSYRVDSSGNLFLIQSVALGAWNSFLPLRVSSINVSPEGKYLFVGFTSNGGYFAIYEISTDGRLSQIGSTKQGVLGGKSVSFAVKNPTNNFLYCALGNEPHLSLAVLSFDGQNLLPTGKEIIHYGTKSANSLTISNDNSFLFVGSAHSVAIFPLDFFGFPISSAATVFDEKKGCGKVLGVFSSLTGKLVVNRFDGFDLFDVDLSNKELVLESSWTISVPHSFGGLSIMEKVDECLNAVHPSIHVPNDTFYIRCEDSVPTVPQFNVTCGVAYWSSVSVYAVRSSCGGRPDVDFEITVTDVCGRIVTKEVKYIRVDDNPPNVEKVGKGSFFLECGESVPHFDFDFLSVEDSCSPFVFPCGFDIQDLSYFHSCNSHGQVGFASLTFAFADGSFNIDKSYTEALHIVDTSPPVFEPFHHAFKVIHHHCDFPSVDSAPIPKAHDKCHLHRQSHPVSINGPENHYVGCGLKRLTWKASDSCGNEGETSFDWILPKLAEAPQIHGVYNTSVDVSSKQYPVIDLLQGCNISLSQTCNPNFCWKDLYVNEERSVTVSFSHISHPSSQCSQYSLIVSAVWKIYYCGNVNPFYQIITVFADIPAPLLLLKVSPVSLPSFHTIFV